MASERENNQSDTLSRLTTITFGYSVEQDRVRLDGVDADGNTLTLWLTARLLNRLVPHLIERQTNMQFSAKGSRSETTDEAELSGEQANSVQRTPDSPEMLVASVDVSTRDDQLLLVFKDSEKAQGGIFVMPLSALQQWNRGLQQCFEQAGWPQSVFQPQSPSGPLGQSAITVH